MGLVASSNLLLFCQGVLRSQLQTVNEEHGNDKRCFSLFLDLYIVFYLLEISFLVVQYQVSTMKLLMIMTAGQFSNFLSI